MSIKYINNIKDLIESETQENKVTLESIEATFEEIKNRIRLLERLVWKTPEVDEQTLRSFFDTAKKEYLSIHPIKIEVSSSLTKEGFKSWLTPQKETMIKWSYTDRYIRYLTDIGRSKDVILETERSSKDIVGKLGDPSSPNTFFTKGLVVGEIQSGKTANFNAVINRSIDCGYQLIIVLSGTMEDLRKQTQDRIELEVTGWGMLPDTDTNGIKGVGNITRFGMQGEEKTLQIESITSRDIDFNSTLLKSGNALNSPKILVCKKNVSVLRNLANWLRDILDSEEDYHSIPMLILDDEADNASLNNEGAKGREYASKINGHIRAILAMFLKKSYLGYTASPFANVLQDRNISGENLWPVMSTNGEREFEQVDNLFPEDFIILLESASNYIGAKQIFETISNIPKLPVVSVVNDHVEEFPLRLLKGDGSPIENIPTLQDWTNRASLYGSFMGFESYSEYRKGTRASRRDDNFPLSLPKSLKEALLSFILCIAVRESRKSNQKNSILFQPHNTMLIHISRFTPWQNKTAGLISDYMMTIKARIENDRPGDNGSIFLELEDIWNRHLANIIENTRGDLPENYKDSFMTPVVFKALQRFIPSAVEDIDILAINSETGQKINYSKSAPRKIIAIGGNRLSRGFTLEGLTINYFVRSTNYSDTLLQMGRWFGYRAGYLDCCRIFTTRDTIEKFNSTTRCIEALEQEFKKMQDQGKSPKNFLLRVRKHPGVLKITRPSILKDTATVKWSFQDQLEMTTAFDIRKEKIESVWNAFRSNIAPIFSDSSRNSNKNFFKAELKNEEFLNFLKIENNFEEGYLDAMRSFIELCQQEGKLTHWTVAVRRIGQSTRKLLPEVTGLPAETGMVIRNGPTKTNLEHRSLFLENRIFRASGRSANIVSSGLDLAIALEQHEIDEAEKKFKEERIKCLTIKGLSVEDATLEVKNTPKTIPERVYRERIPEFKGVLIIYLFDSYYSFNHEKKETDEEFEKFVETEGYNLDIPIVGYAIGFPPIKNDPGGDYVHGDYDLEEDEGGEDDIQNDDSAVPNDDSIALE